jgi:hypothetical protein
LHEGVKPMPRGTLYSPPFMPPFGMQFPNQMPPPPPTMPTMPAMPQQPPPQGQGQPGLPVSDPWQGGINPSMTALLPPEGAPQPAPPLTSYAPPPTLGWPGFSKPTWGAPSEPTSFAYSPAETAQASPPSGATAIVDQPQTAPPAGAVAGIPQEIELPPSTVAAPATNSPGLPASPMRWPPITAGIPIHPEAIHGVPSTSRIEEEVVATAVEAPPSPPVPTISVRPIGQGFSIDGSYSTRSGWNARKKL